MLDVWPELLDVDCFLVIFLDYWDVAIFAHVVILHGPCKCLSNILPFSWRRMSRYVNGVLSLCGADSAAIKPRNTSMSVTTNVPNPKTLARERRLLAPTDLKPLKPYLDTNSRAAVPSRSALPRVAPIVCPRERDSTDGCLLSARNSPAAAR